MAAKRAKEKPSAPAKAVAKAEKAFQKDVDPGAVRFVPRVRKILQKARLILDD